MFLGWAVGFFVTFLCLRCSCCYNVACLSLSILLVCRERRVNRVPLVSRAAYVQGKRKDFQLQWDLHSCVETSDRLGTYSLERPRRHQREETKISMIQDRASKKQGGHQWVKGSLKRENREAALGLVAGKTGVRS